MLIRYVIGRPVPPKEPVRLKAGGVSRDKNRDTTEALYLAACEDLGEHPVKSYVDHLRHRDLQAWQYRLDMYASPETVRAALLDALAAQNMIASTKALPPRNGWHCERCSWRTRCEGDPSASSLASWHDIEDGPPATPLAVTYGRTRKELNRDRIGYCCSPSELRAFLMCPRLWWLEYDQRKRLCREGLKDLPKFVGSLVHEALRMMTMQPGINVRRELDLLTMELCRSGAVNADVQAQLMAPDQLQAMAERATSMHALAMQGVAEVVECEQRRAMVLPGTKKWLHGIPDAVVRMEDGRLALIEYKTTAKGSNLARVADSYRTNPAVHLYAALVQYGALTLQS